MTSSTAATALVRSEAMPRPPTGAYAALVRLWPDVAPRIALRALLTRHGGNIAAAARELEVDRRVLLAAVDLMPPLPGERGERAWFETAWPDRERGGAGVAARAADHASQALPSTLSVKAPSRRKP